jgi:glutamyl-tRNA reductase
VSESVAVLNAKPGRDFAAQFPRAFVWKTCLREIAILDSRQIGAEDLRAGDQLHLREDGYAFLLEVICGLHSPILGETEVFGQFKKFAQRAQESPGWRCTAPWIQRLIADAKRVRTNHLTGLGGRSYGQLARTRLEHCSRILILGAGHLAGETLPWLEEKRVEVFCRRPESATNLLERHAGVRIHPMDAASEHEDGLTGLIIAAPMTTTQIVEWMHRLGCAIDTVVDLRGESPKDPLVGVAARVIHFNEILEDLETNCRFATARVERARADIRQRAQEFWDRYEIRPFGWEDLCA